MWSQIITGLISGAFGFLTAWAVWPIEKRRKALDRQYQLLDSWRAGIATFDDDQTIALSTPWYDTLRQYLSADARTHFEKPRTTFVSLKSARPPRRNLLSSEVDRIERGWGLAPRTRTRKRPFRSG